MGPSVVEILMVMRMPRSPSIHQKEFIYTGVMELAFMYSARVDDILDIEAEILYLRVLQEGFGRLQERRAMRNDLLEMKAEAVAAAADVEGN